MLAVMALGYSALFCVLAVITCMDKWKKYYIASKLLCSLGFLGVFATAGRCSGYGWQFWLMLPAFFCCFVGDLLMAVYNCYRRRSHFLMGLLVFLAGHVCFVRWMCRMQPLSALDFLFPACAVLLVCRLTALRGIHTGRLRPFILIYTFFVALVFAKGMHLAIGEWSGQSLAVAAGSALFLVSDISILFLYFYRKKGYGIHLFNLATYYYGMFLLAVSLIV